MNSEHVQNLRYKLQKRVRRLNSTGYQSFVTGLKQFFNFLRGQPMLLGILDELIARFPNIEAEGTKVAQCEAALVCDNEVEDAALSYIVLKRCSESSEPLCFATIISNYEHTGDKWDEHLEAFRDRFLEPLYEYLDENLDDQRAVLALLRRYKHKCEWFAREDVFKRWEQDTQWGERGLAQHMYEYLHDQGIDLHIEPQSASGEADLIAMQRTDDPLVADAKIFDPDRSKGKSYIAKGFAQVYRYTVDFNEPFGYLIVYLTGKHDLRFTLKEKAQSTPFIVHNNKTIFLMTIDIFPHEESASKRGALTPVEITEEDLIKVAEEVAATPIPAAAADGSPA